MAPEFSFRDSATLRLRLEVSSLLALRAVAQSAKLVQQPPRRARRVADRQQCLEADLICNGRNCNSRPATAGTATAELQQPNCNSRTATAELQQPNYNSRTTTAELQQPRVWWRTFGTASAPRLQEFISFVAGVPIKSIKAKAAKAPIVVVALSSQFSFNISGCLSTSRAPV